MARRASRASRKERMGFDSSEKHSPWHSVRGALEAAAALLIALLIPAVLERHWAYDEARNRVHQLEGDVGRVQAERDRLRDRVAALEDEGEISRAQAELIEAYGSGPWDYASFFLRKDAGKTVVLYPRPGADRVVVMYQGLTEIAGQTKAEFIIASESFKREAGIKSSSPSSLMGPGVLLQLEQGASSILCTGDHDYVIRIEDDGFSSLRAGLAIRPGTFRPQKQNCFGRGCTWGVDSDCKPQEPAS